MTKIKLLIRNEIFVIPDIDEEFLSSLFYIDLPDEPYIGDGNITSMCKDCHLLYIWNKEENPRHIHLVIDTKQPKLGGGTIYRSLGRGIDLEGANMDKEMERIYNDFLKFLKWEDR